VGIEASTNGVGALCFLPLDEAAERAAEALVAGVSRRLAVPCRLLPLAEVGTWPHLEGRDQVDADRLLGRLERTQPDVAVEDEFLIGITGRDIGSPLFTHFFGRARKFGTAALVSLARLAPDFYGLEPDERLARRRAEAEVVHEVGHLLGLGHCRVPSCVMRFAGTVGAIDLRGGQFCPGCARRLPEEIVGQVS
jgi:archaemetzincin